MVEFTVTEEEITKKYVEINDEKIPLSRTIDFLREVEGATTFNSLRWSNKYAIVAEPLVDAGIIGRTNSGSWYVKEEDEREDLYEELISIFD